MLEPLFPIPYPDPEIQKLFEQMDRNAALFAKEDRAWTQSDAGHKLFTLLLMTAEMSLPNKGQDVLRMGICAAMPSAAGSTAEAVIRKMRPELQARSSAMLARDLALGDEDLGQVADAVMRWQLWAEEFAGPEASIQLAFVCGLIWVRLHQRHAAASFVLP